MRIPFCVIVDDEVRLSVIQALIFVIILYGEMLAEFLNFVEISKR